MRDIMIMMKDDDADNDDNNDDDEKKAQRRPDCFSRFFFILPFPFFLSFRCRCQTTNVSWARNRMKLETLPGRGEHDVLG